ncbi:hypothetical protein FIBSPDRAFT_859036, partial [Athelia psychrophila]
MFATPTHVGHPLCGSCTCKVRIFCEVFLAASMHTFPLLFRCFSHRIHPIIEHTVLNEL